jgi:hypothetical protein
VEPLSPELVLVSPPEDAAVARALLETPWPPLRYERRRPTRFALACVYLACLLVTALPVAFLVAIQR